VARPRHQLVSRDAADLDCAPVEFAQPIPSWPAIKTALTSRPELAGGRAEVTRAEAEVLAALEIRAVTPASGLPPAAVERLRLAPEQVNVLLRLVLQPLDRTLTDEDANLIRDRVYLALHQGRVIELIGG